MDTTVCEIISPEPAQIMISELKELIIYFSKHTYRATVADNVSQDIIQKCLSLIDVDYKYSIIYNNTGDICSHYPTHLIILEEEKIDKYRDAEVIDVPLSLSCTEDVTDKFANINKLKDLIKKANAARCRSRFPLPVIMYKGRHICRSATLSGGAEIYTKRGLDYFLSTSEDISEQVDETEEKVDETKQEIDETELSESSSQPSQWNLFDKVRNKDIKLLKTFNVGIIIDFMVEKKKVKYGFHVSSSEKVDKFGRYSDFSIISLPYPGCEFFKGFRENDYVGDNLIFDWSQAWVDAEINVPEDRISSQLQIDWDQYQQWDILVLTQNYLKLILRYLSQSSNGMLIHCISGWDRTPLFISLLRLSLWADNVIHKSLNPYQMLYYTIAYDWMLFGHDLQDRLSKGEEIFFFCFYFLKYICDEDFSIKQDFYQCDSKSDDDEIKHPIFDMEPVTEDPSISASGSDSNKNSRASRDSKDSQNKYSSADIISTNSPPKTEEFGDSIKHDLEFETIFPMELETEDQSPFLKLINSNKNSRDDQDEPLPKMVWTWNISPSKLKDFSFTKPPSLSSSLFEEEITHELVVSHDQTPPVVVPGSRQRTKSTTSAGSWEVVTETGSLTDSATTTGQPLIEQPTIEPSISTRKLKERESVTHFCSSNRKDRLCFLRNTFYTVYSQIGFQMKENSTPGNLKQMFQTFTGMFSSESTTL